MFYSSTGEMLNQAKEKLRRIIEKSQIEDGEDENGNPIYKTVAKTDALEEAMNIFDEVAYQFEETRISGVVLEKLLHQYCPDLNKKQFLQDYMIAVEAEHRNDTYIYDNTDIDRNIRRMNFSVINGGKQD